MSYFQVARPGGQKKEKKDWVNLLFNESIEEEEKAYLDAVPVKVVGRVAWEDNNEIIKCVVHQAN
jgi:hypothetical protein